MRRLFPVLFAVFALCAVLSWTSTASFAQLRSAPPPSVAAIPVDPAPSHAGAAESRVPHQGTDRVEALVREREAAERAHLWRVAAWGGLNAVGGLALVLGSGKDEHPAWRGFGIQSGLWGAVNVGIATVGLLSGGEPPTGYDAAVAAERWYHDILLFNLALNVGYSSVGTTMAILSYRGARSARSLRGHGSALIMQGAGLFVLDAIALLGSRTRLAGLLDVAGSLSGRALPTGFALTWTL